MSIRNYTKSSHQVRNNRTECKGRCSYPFTKCDTNICKSVKRGVHIIHPTKKHAVRSALYFVVLGISRFYPDYTGLFKTTGNSALQWRHNEPAVVSQITDVSIVRSTFGSGADLRKHHSSASLAFVRAIQQWPVNSPHKRPVTQKMFPLDDVIMGIIHLYQSELKQSMKDMGK